MAGKLTAQNAVQSTSRWSAWRRRGRKAWRNFGGQRCAIFLRACSRMSRSPRVRLWMPRAEILSRIGSTSLSRNSPADSPPAAPVCFFSAGAYERGFVLRADERRMLQDFGDVKPAHRHAAEMRGMSHARHDVFIKDNSQHRQHGGETQQRLRAQMHRDDEEISRVSSRSGNIIANAAQAKAQADAPTTGPPKYSGTPQATSTWKTPPTMPLENISARTASRRATLPIPGQRRRSPSSSAGKCTRSGVQELISDQLPRVTVRNPSVLKGRKPA